MAAISAIERAVSFTRQKIVAATTPQTKFRALWAGAKHAHNFAASDVINELFFKLGREFSGELGRHADEDLRHVVAWASRGMNPFGRGNAQ